MTRTSHGATSLAALLLCAALAGCGGGGDSAAPAQTASTTPTPSTEAGAPAFVGNTAIDGQNWINFRRGQVGMPVLLPNAQVASAAQAHSTYQKLNNKITHEEDPSKQGFTGVRLDDRLAAAGYVLRGGFAYGEVISATSSASGFYMAEELITAIYHRFVIFEPKFKEVGTGSATTSSGYNYFTSDFTATNGYGPGLGRGKIVSWPYDGQTNVPPNFFSDYEEPDPVYDADPAKNINEVGYPLSVHADIDAVLTVQSFTVRPRGGEVLSSKLLARAVDANSPASAAAIIPLTVLRAATTYDVSFVGTIDGTPVSKNWSFTTK